MRIGALVLGCLGFIVLGSVFEKRLNLGFRGLVWGYVSRYTKDWNLKTWTPVSREFLGFRV